MHESSRNTIDQVRDEALQLRDSLQLQVELMVGPINTVPKVGPTMSFP